MATYMPLSINVNLEEPSGPDHVLLSPPPDDSLKSPLAATFTGRAAHARDAISPPGPFSHWIYWRIPALMVIFFLIGVLACLAHHLFYSFLDGQPVLHDMQQRSIRIGSLLAWIAQHSLTSSVWLAYTQWIWFSVTRKKATTSLRTLDAAFKVDSSALSLLDVGLFQHLKVAFALALAAWCLQIPALITPATLSVIPRTQVTVPLNVSVPDIAAPSLQPSKSFAYDVPLSANSSSNDTDLEYVGARTILLTIASATSSAGRILDITPPLAASNSSYTVSFYGPRIRCFNGSDFPSLSTTINNTVNARVQQPEEGNFFEIMDAYSAFIPLNLQFSPGNPPVPIVDGTPVDALWNLSMIEAPLPTATNELWLQFWRYTNESGYYNIDGQSLPNPRWQNWLRCLLYNASYDVTLSWENGNMEVTNNRIIELHPVSFPVDLDGVPSQLEKHSYTAFFQAVASRLTGWMGYYNNPYYNASGSDVFPGVANYSSILSPIGSTSLIGSNDLDFYFDVNKNLYINNSQEVLSLQRLQDKALAKNRTLQALIEELSFNTTISLMHDPLLTTNVTTDVTTTAPGNQFAYYRQNLVIAYSIAVLMAFAVDLFGGWAYRKNGTAFGRSFSTFASITRDSRLRVLFPPCCQGSLPLPPAALDEPVTVEMVEDDAGHVVGLTMHPVNANLESVQQTICPACSRRRRARTTSGTSPSLEDEIAEP